MDWPTLQEVQAKRVLYRSHFMNKIIFLDFDGVLNTERYQNFLMYQRMPCQDQHGSLFNPEAVSQLKRIVDVTKADIVIESSWKYLGLSAMQEMWKERNLPGQVIDITDSSVSDNWLLTANLEDIDPAMGHCKGMEIASWLTDNTKVNIPYAIIDDEYVCLDSQIPHFVLTNPHDVITENIADKVIAILEQYFFSKIHKVLWSYVPIRHNSILILHQILNLITKKITTMALKNVKVTMSRVGVHTMEGKTTVYMPLAKIDYMEAGKKKKNVYLDDKMVSDKKYFKGWILGASYFVGVTADS